MATNKRANLLKEALFSILNQSFTNFECIVVDDANDEETKKIVDNLSITDSRFRYLKRPDTFRKGLSGCRNFALQCTTAKYIHFVDDDDLLHPQFLELKHHAAEQSNADYVVSPLLNFRNNPPLSSIVELVTSTYKVDWQEFVMDKTGIFSCSVLWNVRCLIGFRFDEDLTVSEDWDLYRKLFSNFTNGVYLNTPLYFRRLHSQTNSEQLRLNNSEYRKSYLKVRERAVNDFIEKDELTVKLATFFLKLSYKYNYPAIYKAINIWSRNRADWGMHEKLEVLKYRFYLLLRK